MRKCSSGNYPCPHFYPQLDRSPQRQSLSMFILFLRCLALCLVSTMLRRLSDRFVCCQRALSPSWVLGLKFRLGKTLMDSEIFKGWGESIPQKEGRNLVAGIEVSLIHLYSRDRWGKYLAPRGRERVAGRWHRHHLWGKPIEGVSFPATTESPSWAAASLAPGGSSVNYQTQIWALHFYEMLTQEANLFPKKKNEDGWEGRGKLIPVHTNSI